MNVFKAVLIHVAGGTAFFVGSGILVSGLAGHGWAINTDSLIATPFDIATTVFMFGASVFMSVVTGEWLKVFFNKS